MFSKIYALHDSSPEKKRLGAFEIDIADAEEYNAKGFGIFGTFNDYEGARKKDNITKINFWFADIDEGNKEEQMERINNLSILPTIVIETKNGYHCYWKAIDATIECFSDIQKGLIHRLDADKACKDPVRLLRCPHYNHMKNPSKPFKIKIVWNNHKEYNESRMLCVYKLPEPKPKKYGKLDYSGSKEDMLKEENWDKIFNLNMIGEGGRNNELSRICFWLRDENFPRDVVENTIRRMNSSLSSPLPTWELDILINSKF